MSPSTAEVTTDLLRQSAERPYPRLRELLAERGIEVSTCVLADLFPDDGDQEFGVIVTSDRRVATFEMHYGRGDLGKQLATAFLWNWVDITDTWQSESAVVRDRAEEGLALVASQSRQRGS